MSRADGVCTCPETDPLKRAAMYTVRALGVEPHAAGCPRWGRPAAPAAEAGDGSIDWDAIDAERRRNLGLDLAAPVAEAGDELREEIARGIAESRPWGERWDSLADCPGDALRNEYRKTADAVLALPALQRLVAEAAEAARLRAVVERVEALADEFAHGDPVRLLIERAIRGDE